MKRYAVFAYDHYYPLGGVLDLKGIFDEYADAKKQARALSLAFNVSYVFDTEENKLLALFSEYAEYHEGVKTDIENQAKFLSDESN